MMQLYVKYIKINPVKNSQSVTLGVEEVTHQGNTRKVELIKAVVHLLTS